MALGRAKQEETNNDYGLMQVQTVEYTGGDRINPLLSRLSLLREEEINTDPVPGSTYYVGARFNNFFVDTRRSPQYIKYSGRLMPSSSTLELSVSFK